METTRADRGKGRLRRIALPLLAGVLALAGLALQERPHPAEPDVPAATVARGYSIPTIDLSGRLERRAVVDREDGQYLGHPTTVLLEDGRTILAVYPKGHGAGPIVMKMSRDGGLTWSGRLPVPENWATSKETPTIHRVTGPSGEKRLLLFSGLYPARLAVS
ncbi:MAG: hypothetical protein JW742_05020, partial [Candidatus Aminicenantes bacterium]|nr:hypothetical protein [Candidatus Aminicenantes bacterium]